MEQGRLKEGKGIQGSWVDVFWAKSELRHPETRGVGGRLWFKKKKVTIRPLDLTLGVGLNHNQ